ncbi:NAD(+)--rifampin ADP-ribosyltransferase [Synechococcus sp. Nb3U1]
MDPYGYPAAIWDAATWGAELALGDGRNRIYRLFRLYAYP